MADGLGVVLEREHLAGVVQDLAGCRPEPEAALLAAELPDDCASAAVHLVGRPGEPGADQQVPVRVQVSRVDMEPVPGGAGRRRQRHVAVPVGDVAGAIPLEKHLARGDVDFLHDAVDDRLIGGSAHAGQVRRGDLVSQDQCGVPRRDNEFVPAGRVATGGPHRGDLTVPVAVDVAGDGRQQAGSAEVAELAPGEHWSAAVSLGAEVCRALASLAGHGTRSPCRSC